MAALIRVADPPFNGAVPSKIVPSWKKVTLPVGATGPVVVTWALKVTRDPGGDGFGLEVSVVLVWASSTT